MFIGVDHGTRAIRFANHHGDGIAIPRSEAGSLRPEEILNRIKDHFHARSFDLVALCYSMGDGITRITRLQDADNRGLARLSGAGIEIGGGTRVYEAMAISGWPVVLLPGIHRGSSIDLRMKVFSHGASPEKVGLSYYVVRRGVENAVIADASSNTVTIGINERKIVGAIDAPIFAPGLLQGPLDVDAIRAVDDGMMTANEAFSHGGILRRMNLPDEHDDLALETLALFAAMEMSAMSILLKDLGAESPDMFLAGDPAPYIAERVSELLGIDVIPLPSFASATGCAWIAEDIFAGMRSIMGIDVDERVFDEGGGVAGGP
ncbi:MAG: methanogenesis marker 12 protein [Methanothrix sp.]|nr:methanogenesis marker 12 protein [Methanothrix sp.]MCX8206580.1 methanogenesis marker 12 protein [Methanothrix sp.]